MNPNTEEMITHLHPTDVLFGRGSGPNDHAGNIAWRVLVADRKDEYMATNHRQTKAKIARDIVDAVRKNDGRFLKKIEGAEASRRAIPDGVDAYLIADEETVIEKAKQALRQHREKDTPTKSPKLGPKKPKSKKPPAAKVEDMPPAASCPGSAPRTDTSLAGRQYYVEPATHSAPIPMHPNGYNQAAMQQQQHWTQYQYPPQYPPEGYPQQQELYVQQQHYPQQHHPGALSHTPRSQQNVLASGDIPAQHPSLGDEYARSSSLNVHDLMEPFGNLKTKEKGATAAGDDKLGGSSDTMGMSTGSQEHGESSDTMGSIEPINVEGNSKEGLSSMSSATFQALKGAFADSDNKTVKTDSVGSSLAPMSVASDAAVCSFNSGNSRKQPARNKSLDIGDVVDGIPKPASTDASMSLSQVWDEKRQAFVNKGIAEGSTEEEKDESGSTVKRLAHDPRPVTLMEDDPDLMSGLGTSSMSILKTVMGGGDSSNLTAGHGSVFSDLGDDE